MHRSPSNRYAARRATLVAAVAIAFGLAIVPLGDASAQGAPAKGGPPPKGGKPAKPPPAPTTPAKTSKIIAVSPSTITWGMSSSQVATVYDKVLDEEWKPKYKKVQPGNAMQALDAELAERKAEIRRSLIKFGEVPTGYDATPLKGEYSYGNKEAVMNVTRDGRERYFFFIQDKLYKVVDEHKLGEGKSWGKTFDEAAGKLKDYYGVAGRVREPDATNGLSLKEVDWSDGKGHLRASQRSDTAIGLIFEDETTVAALPGMRTNKLRDATAIDPAVNDILRKPDAPPGPPPGGDKNPKGKPPAKGAPPAPPPKK